ncbi:hypothetical protein HDU98_007816 [Podochytrium sp. JEL0797]|nr:hypothetical protein HDU98_007816 [Podochytrium sp. JEL0797]
MNHTKTSSSATEGEFETRMHSIVQQAVSHAISRENVLHSVDSGRDLLYANRSGVGSLKDSRRGLNLVRESGAPASFGFDSTPMATAAKKGEFEQKVHSIVNEAVTRAIMKENLTGSYTLADSPPETIVTKGDAVVERTDPTHGTRAESPDSPSGSPPTPHKRDMERPIASKHTPTAKKSTLHKTIPKHRTTSTSSNTASISTKHTPNHTPLITTLLEKIETLMSRIDHLESHHTAHKAMDRFDVDKAIQSRLKVFESRMDGMDARILQMEARFLMNRAEEYPKSVRQPLAHMHEVETLLKTTLPSLQSHLETLTLQLKSHRINTTESIQDLESAFTTHQAQHRSLSSHVDEVVESVKVLQGRFDFQLVAMENLRKLGGAAGGSGGGKKSGAELESISLEKRVNEKWDDVKKSMGSKVDTSVLEELMRHLATRDELKRMHEKLAGKQQKSGMEKVESVKREVFDEVRKLVDVRLQNFKKEVKAIAQDARPDSTQPRSLNGVTAVQMHETLDVLEHRWMDQLERATSNTLHNLIPETLLTELKHEILDHVKSTTLPDHFDSHATEQTHHLLNTLHRDFDEKLYLLSTDLTACKTAYETAVRQPFYRCAQFLWTSSTLKLGSSIPWDLQSTNTDPHNFKWTPGSTCIRIRDPGLYELSFAFFNVTWRPSVQVVVNGESVLSALNAPGYVVRHSSGFVKDGDGVVREGTVTGLSLLDFLSLPAKSTVAIHYHAGRKEVIGHGFLGLRRL